MDSPADLGFVPPPVQRLPLPSFEAKGVALWVLRLDLVHAQIGGNKWYKLKHNIVAAKQQGFNTLLTFGGAYSNHLYATAAAGKLFGFGTVGVVRGEPNQPLNPVLQFARHCGMTLHYLDRQRYRQKHSPEVLAELQAQFGPCYVVPEGGSNALAVLGGAEILPALPNTYHYVCCACGTGGTLAGLVAGASPPTQLLGIAVLKGDFLSQEVQNLLKEAQQETSVEWQVLPGYHFGGYAKCPPTLRQWVDNFNQQWPITIEPIYTGKLFYALNHLAEQGYFASGTSVLAVHTGGVR